MYKCRFKIKFKMSFKKVCRQKSFALEAVTGKRQFEAGMGISEVLPQRFFLSSNFILRGPLQKLQLNPMRIRFVRGYGEETCCGNGGAASDWSWFDWGEVMSLKYLNNFRSDIIYCRH